MNWVRINTTLPESPEVMQLSEELRIDPDWAFGIAVRWLCWLDNFSEDGETRCTRSMIDRKFRKGFTAALEHIGWAEVDASGQVHAVNFEKYNGESAKKRAESAVRMARMRGKRGAAAENVLQKSDAHVTETLRESYAKNVTSASPTIQYNNKEDMGGSISTATIGNRPQTAPARMDLTEDEQTALRSEEFSAWWDSLSDALPPLKRLRCVPLDAARVAVDAFRCVPDAAGMELQPKLARYYAAKAELLEKRKVRIYRPTSCKAIMSALHDILTLAEEFCRRDDAAKAKLEARRREQEKGGAQ